MGPPRVSLPLAIFVLLPIVGAMIPWGHSNARIKANGPRTVAIPKVKTNAQRIGLGMASKKALKPHAREAWKVGTSCSSRAGGLNHIAEVIRRAAYPLKVLDIDNQSWPEGV